MGMYPINLTKHIMKKLEKLLAIVIFAVLITACTPTELSQEDTNIQTDPDIVATGGEDTSTTDDDRD